MFKMQGTKKERYNFYNSLVCLAKALEGHYTLVDLRNEAYLTGKIEQVDGFMNLEMSDVTFYNSRGKEYSFEFFFVHARNIRYIHIPENLSSLQLIEDGLLRNNRRKPTTQSKKKTYKQKRAEKYQQELVQDIMQGKS